MKICQMCGKEYDKPNDYSKKQWESRKNCSLSCVAKSRLGKPWHLAGLKDFARKGCPKPEGHVKRGTDSPNWKGGFYAMRDGRLIQSHSCGRKIKARLIAEQSLGRLLKTVERVHHINENKTDDRPENLFVFRSMSAHVRWHNFLRRHNLQGLLESNLISQNV